ncbi:CLUMA_CG021216, isoform A [Clunio marinus]|uniref:CLUMA_CG021216, isoform A n=1 Tax=Clunio marinus TaxID=568069 RepID=A0A1J1J9F8_9DIPT|nr:CLUMA_CG021216, isoform A [Clunio marinus]
METVDKFASIPMVESGLKVGMIAYNRVKRTNQLTYWGLQTSENVILSLLESLRPIVKLVEKPLVKIDKIGLSVLERFEENMPNLYLPPQMIYWNTKEYVSDNFVQPVLKRANSFGDIVDGALDKADNALDKYLPDIENIKTDESEHTNEKGNHAVQTYRRGKKISKKLKHKLTSRTVAEVRALKNDVHVLIYAAEMIVKNPKLAIRKSKEIWNYLSLNEPENQKRPETLEELFVLLVRETSRKIVHLINFSVKLSSRVQNKTKSFVSEIVHQIFYFSDWILKTIHLDLHKISLTYEDTMEKLAIFFSGRLEAEKIEMSSQSRVYTRPSSINGLY